jgi:cobalt-zinc-cadmium efflux system membrane fusion protein
MKNHLPYTALFLSAIAAACSSPEPKAPEMAVQANTEQTNQIQLDSAEVARLGLQTEVPQNRVMTYSVYCTGMVEAPPQSVASIHSTVGGYVTKIRPYVGQVMQKGEIIAELEHPDFVTLQQDYLVASAELKVLEAEAERQRTLRAGNANAVKTLERAESDFQIKSAQVSGLATRLRMAGIAPETVTAASMTSKVAIRAPFTGFVSEVHVNLGKYVGPQEVIGEMINSGHLHLELKVFEQDMHRVKAGQRIVFQAANAPAGTPLEAEVEMVAGHVDPAERTVNIHGHLTGSAPRELRPGSMVKAEIQTEAKPAFTLPETAVFSEEGSFWVVVREEGNVFVKQEIRIAGRQDGFVALQPGQTDLEKARVVVTGLRGLRMAWSAE